MIFVTVGSQKFQFNRLLVEIDKLVEEKIIIEEVFAQIGYSDYKPKNYKYKEFLDRDEFANIMEKWDKLITHGGTGAIIGAVKRDKKVIAVPRLSKYGEHVDDHQLQIVKQFDHMGLISSISDINELKKIILSIEKIRYKKYVSNTNEILSEIECYINK